MIENIGDARNYVVDTDNKIQEIISQIEEVSGFVTERIIGYFTQIEAAVPEAAPVVQEKLETMAQLAEQLKSTSDEVMTAIAEL